MPAEREGKERKEREGRKDWERGKESNIKEGSHDGVVSYGEMREDVGERDKGEKLVKYIQYIIPTLFRQR